MSRPLRALIHVLFLVSGATALVYQVTWLRNLSLVFGASFEATSIVLAAFMAGLSAGGFAFARRAERVDRAFALYGLLELGVAAFALVVPALLRALDAVYVEAAGAQGGVTPTLNALRVVFSLAILFVPTFLMGGTLPVLARGLVRSRGDFGPRLAWLYGINTLGAVIGAVCAGFVLIPSLGVWRTQLVAVAANVVIGLTALAAGRVLRGAEGAAPEEPEAALAPISSGERRALWLAYAGTALAGMCALALEVMWARAISLAVGATTYSFTVMLAAFLSGIWLGSWLHAAFPLRRIGPALQLGLVLCAIGLASALTSFWIPRLPELAVSLNGALFGEAPRIRAATILLLGFLVMLPPCVFMGVAFPLAGEARARLARGFGRSAGDTLGLNTLGSIAGSLLAGFVWIPLLGLQHGMLQVASLYFAYGCLLVAAAARTSAAAPASRMAIGLAAGVCAALALLAPRFVPPWSKDVLGAFQNDHIASFVDASGRADLAGRMAGWSVLYFREGRASTVSVVDQGWNRTLIVNGKAEASDDPIDGYIQLMLGHVPVLMHPDPKSAFILGMGTGITLGAVTAHPGLEQIVLGEIEPAVLGARPWFQAVNGDPLGDPRLEVAIQDGRNFLKTTRRRFDVITADPIHPWTSGSVYLYTREYYEIARDRLTPHGVMCQWLPLTGLSGEDVRSVVATFASVFPHTSLWQSSHDVLLIGSMDPRPPDLAALRERLQAPKVKAQLASLGLDDPIAFLADQGMDDLSLRAYVAGAVLNTDDNVRLEFSSPLAIGDPDLSGVTLRVNKSRTALAAAGITAVAGLDDAQRESLRRARHAKNQLVLAQVMPKRQVQRLEEVVAQDPDYRPARIQLARWLAQQGAEALDAGRVEIARARAQQALALADEEPAAHLLEGSVLATQGRFGEAVAPIERALARGPERWMAEYQLGLALLGAGRRDEAAAALERAVALNPAHAELAAQLAAARGAEQR
ncbi:MAG TPA: fused MFS/spermidine synthase [Myxococcota bacterium]|nr:fused MFS/spermidine synthase [Myxococcota bacterium]